ncbi:TIGR03905 family TSCPD domain-containing protein [Kineothrix sp. MB12-C1]|uniref:TIGR03905 family TSCPD domain-containing protein n=1 Tax=Kineothrix sp. MB12-C1 TaxID=3070215 RepID=UPI0027D2941C|nr:TIGR03905 family TSCPD domain-containing protein [Kineothrix sp. MB12-C1]WMC91144.1 TIGR03905 family TSCPD domain-containing protein [Kineothrix sp. MB12-C1]
MKYQPKGVCPSSIDVELSDDIIQSVSFTGGCNGNLQGISKLVEGMKAQDAIERLQGITCGHRVTSCPDQLANALTAMISNK